MTTTAGMNPVQPSRLDELLADRALDALDYGDAAELRALMDGDDMGPSSLDVTAAVTLTSMLRESEVQGISPALRERLMASGRAWCDEARGAGGAIPIAQGRRSPDRLRALPWLAAAAGIILAVVAWWPSAAARNARGERQALLATAGDAVTLSWKDWDSPEVAGVTGDVVWSDTAQRGYMRFANLPAKDPLAEQYQLWIVDKRGMGQRISGGIFNGGATEVIVPIEPGIRVDGAAAFAVTIEKPGGTWVSDMTRRVVIAAK